MNSNIFALIVQHCQGLLHNSPVAEPHREYLNGRLLKETQNKFGFGYFPDVAHFSLLTDIISEKQLEEIGLLRHWEMQDSVSPRRIQFNFFENQSLIMPYRNAYGEVVALVGRSILGEDTRRALEIEKYKNTQFTKGNHLFGLYEAKESILRAGFVYIVEGQLDVIKAMERGISNIVGLGTSNMTDYQLSLICRYTNNLLLLLDNDEAGFKGRREIIKKYGEYANFQDVYLPDGYKDIDEYLHNNEATSISLLSKKVIMAGGL